MSVSEDVLHPSSDSFWEVECYKRTVKRQDDGLKLCGDLMTLIHDRAEIEKNYAKSLKAWSQKWNSHIEKGPEYGTMEASCKSVLEEADRVADLHLEVKESLMNEVSANIKQWKGENFRKGMMGTCKEAKELEDGFKKAQKPWSKKLQKVQKARKEYHTACKLEKTATHQENNARGDSGTSPDQMKKLQDRAEKCRRDVIAAKERYEAALSDIDSYNARYMEDMSETYDRSQEYEEKRLQFFKEMLYGIHKCVDISSKEQFPQIYSQLHQAIGIADHTKDLKWWSQNHGVDMAMNWPAFEEYSDELKEISKKKRSQGFSTPVMLRRINKDQYHKEFVEYSPNMHTISKKEKKGMTGGDGITLTAINRSETASQNTYASLSNNQPPPPQQPQSEPASIKTSSHKPLHKQESYDPDLNPFGGDEDKTIDLDKVIKEEVITTETKKTEEKTKSETEGKAKEISKDYDESLNPFGNDSDEEFETAVEEQPEDKKQNSPPPRPKAPPRPPRKKHNNGGQDNPFGEEWADEYENPPLVDDGSDGTPVRALFDYVGQEADELSFKIGDVFVMLESRDDQGWCKGRKEGKLGLYPDNYVETL